MVVDGDGDGDGSATAPDGGRHVEVLSFQRLDVYRCAIEFLALAPQIPVATHTTPMPLSEANAALDRLRRGDLTGALVLVPDVAA